jgi:tRNA threonylcarbamoyladenosine modification (KEOPS) complex Cgi121 subunit
MPESLTLALFIVRVRRGDEERFLSRLREALPRLFIQLLSMRGPPNRRQIEMIVNQTVRSMAGRSLLAARPEIDLLLRMAGTTQISEAIRKVGYKAGGVKVVVAIGSGRELRKIQRLADEEPATYERICSAELTSSDLETIERAALLGITST